MPTDLVDFRVLRIAYTAIAVFTLLAAGCHETRESSADKLSTASAPTQVATTSTARVVSSAPTLSAPTSAFEASTAATAEPPKLQAVLSKPFPDGASDEQVCAAIANTGEKDLWVRFGHLVPLHVHASILIIDAKPEHIKRIERFVMGYHNGVYWPSIKHCSAGKAMLYVRDLSEGSPNAPPGQLHLSRVISRELGLAVTESFAFRSNKERLSDYCRLDAELCEQLVKLDYANRGKGLCSHAIVSAGSDASQSTHLKPCLQLPANAKACAYIHWTREERDQREQCECRLRAGLGLSQLRANCD